jgi:2'-hydroxyisoflavone reductase
VYADHSVRQIEGAEVLRLSEHTPAEDQYGAAKAACEKVVEDRYGNRAFIVRPGLIVGPHDPTDRFAYWPRRMTRGGTVLAPGGPADPLQFIDVRDLGRFIVAGAADGVDGVYNVAGPPIGFGSLLTTCQEVTDFQGELIWLDSGRLLAAGADPWMGVPLWIAAPGWEAANDVDTTRARAAGLTFRPVAETLADVLAWDQARAGPEHEGLTAAEEIRLLTHHQI